MTFWARLRIRPMATVSSDLPKLVMPGPNPVNGSISRTRPRPPRSCDTQVASPTWRRVVVRFAKGSQPIPLEHVRARRDHLGPGKLPQQPDQRRQLGAGHQPAELNPGVTAATLPASAQRHPGHPGRTIGRPDHGDAIGFPRLARPRFHLKFLIRGRAGHQELKTAPDADERTPDPCAQILDTLGPQAPALTSDPQLAGKRGHSIRHETTLKSASHRPATADDSSSSSSRSRRRCRCRPSRCGNTAWNFAAKTSRVISMTRLHHTRKPNPGNLRVTSPQAPMGQKLTVIMEERPRGPCRLGQRGPDAARPAA